MAAISWSFKPILLDRRARDRDGARAVARHRAALLTGRRRADRSFTDWGRVHALVVALDCARTLGDRRLVGGIELVRNEALSARAGPGQPRDGERPAPSGAQRFADVANRQPNWGEAIYLLGICEESLGHFEAAMTAWSRVPPDSPFATKAVLGRVGILSNMGRFTPAETLLESLGTPDGPDGLRKRQTHEHLLRLEGRIQERAS